MYISWPFTLKASDQLNKFSVFSVVSSRLLEGHLLQWNKYICVHRLFTNQTHVLPVKQSIRLQSIDINSIFCGVYSEKCLVLFPQDGTILVILNHSTSQKDQELGLPASPRNLFSSHSDSEPVRFCLQKRKCKKQKEDILSLKMHAPFFLLETKPLNIVTLF